MIKMIFTDIDGTLVPDGSMNLNPEYFDVINKLYDRGIQVTVVSGRHSCSVKQLFAPVKDKIWIISQNGAVIEKGDYSEVLSPIPRELIRELWQDLSVFDRVDSIIETEKMSYCPNEGSEMHQLVIEGYGYSIQATGGWTQIPEETFSMFTVYFPDGGEEFCNRHLKPKWEGRIDMYPSGEPWVDCVMPGVNKGNSAKILCDKYKIDRKDVIAFGDNMNDLPLLKMAGVGYAVDNARDELLRAADRIIPGYHEDGVLKVMKKFLL